MYKYLQISAIVILIIMIMGGCSINDADHSLLSDIEGPRSKVLFDFEWKFYRGNADGAEKPDFDDSMWRTLDLPHDWSIEDIPGTYSPIDSLSIGGIDMGYFQGGTGWYRKNFKIPSEIKGKRISIIFEGIYMNSDIWLNGIHLGNHPYGYTSFWYDITEQLQYDKNNVIAVEVKNEGKNSRWYSGSGIYRHVWIDITEPVHVAHWGTYITTPQVNQSKATVIIENKINNHLSDNRKLIILTRIIDKNGNEIVSGEISREADPGSDLKITQEFEIPSPDLWSLETPSLYTAVTEIKNSGLEILDKVKNKFGIRSISFTSDGFFLNGENILLKGGCVHHDNGPLGAAAYDRAEERRVKLMKASGFNAIRCAHNPPSPSFLDACDKLGILVIDESFDMWVEANWPQDYHLYFNEWWQKDIESMVLRDRNHPSIIMWSIGNEIREMTKPVGIETSKKLGDFVRDLDPSRSVTAAVNKLSPDKDPFFATLDIAGYNYAYGGDHNNQSIFEIDHKRVPDRIMYCSESFPLEAYGAWMNVLDFPYVFGDFVWTGFDYLGEASIGWLGYLHRDNFYPWHHAFCGDIDICGFKRPQSFYRDVLWQHEEGYPLSVFVKPPEPSFEMIPGKKDWSKWNWHDLVAEWNWEGYEGKKMEVVVYNMYDEVELFLNDESLGRKETNRENQWIATYMIPYEAGELKAVAYEENTEIADFKLLTAGDPEKIQLTADRIEIKASGHDLSYITVELIDKNGIRNPRAENLINFEIKGPGEIIAVGSSNPVSSESYQKPYRKAYRGRCLVIVKSTKEAGIINLDATSPGLQPASLRIITK
jgi:beta-galactosidase